MHSNIDDVLTRFLAANCESDLIEVVIDTSVAVGDGQEMVPYLNLWAFNVAKDRDLVSVLKEVANTENWGYLEDAVQERDSSIFEISLQSFYPRWPEDFDEGNERIVSVLVSAAKRLCSETACLFHHVDAWPPIDLKTGKEIDLALL